MKHTKMLKLWVIVFLTISAFFLASCEKDDDKLVTPTPTLTPTPTPTPTPTVKTGYFLDSAVQGVQFKSGEQSGTTGSDGAFTYEEDGTVTFSVGNITVGSGIAQTNMTPVDLVSGATDTTNQTVINIACLLQTFDSDGDPTNGISISAATTTALEDETLDLTSSTSDFESDFGTIISDLSETHDITLTQVSEANAVSHLDDTISEIKRTSMVGSWTIGDNFDSSNPSNITFYSNGYYVQYTDCSNHPDGLPDLEIGTYTNDNSTLTITSHIQNGCGGFDDDDDSSIPPADALNISFNEIGSTVTLTDYDFTINRVASDYSLIVGSWTIGDNFDSSNPSNITFYSNGYYVQYTDCSNHPDGLPDLEVGTYSSDNSTLTITSHIQNGCGGFDDDNDSSIPPTDVLNIFFNEDGSTVTLADYDLTINRVAE